MHSDLEEIRFAVRAHYLKHLQKIPYSNEYNILLGRVNNNTWVGIAPTVYVETTR